MRPRGPFSPWSPKTNMGWGAGSISQEQGKHSHPVRGTLLQNGSHYELKRAHLIPPTSCPRPCHTVGAVGTGWLEPEDLDTASSPPQGLPTHSAAMWLLCDSSLCLSFPIGEARPSQPQGPGARVICVLGCRGTSHIWAPRSQAGSNDV